MSHFGANELIYGTAFGILGAAAFAGPGLALGAIFGFAAGDKIAESGAGPNLEGEGAPAPA